MAAGDLASLKKYKTAIKALHTAGTTVRFILASGDIETFTISGATTAKLCHVNPTNVSAFWTDNTYIYLGYKNGALRRVTVANNVNSQLAKFDCAVNAIAVTGTTLYVGLSDGHLYSYALV
jgi:hypothetical protein